MERREGLALGCAVLVTDAVANGYADYALDSSQGATAGRIGQSAITTLAVALLDAAPGYGLGSTPPSAPSRAILIRKHPLSPPLLFPADPTHAVPQMCHGTLLWGRFQDAYLKPLMACGITSGAGRA